jgi:hypothetical protein
MARTNSPRWPTGLASITCPPPRLSVVRECAAPMCDGSGGLGHQGAQAELAHQRGQTYALLADFLLHPQVIVRRCWRWAVIRCGRRRRLRGRRSISGRLVGRRWMRLSRRSGNCCGYIAQGLPSCLVMPAARAHGSQLGFHPLGIRRAARFACSEPLKLVQFVQLDQHERLASDFASASHAEGRWFDPSRDHYHRCRAKLVFGGFPSRVPITCQILVAKTGPHVVPAIAVGAAPAHRDVRTFVLAG